MPFRLGLQIRKIICNVVLSTDMGSHFDLLDVFHKAVKEHPDIWAWQDRNLITIMAMHLSDILNPARPVEIALKWGRLIVQECFEQVRVLTLSRLLHAFPAQSASANVLLSLRLHAALATVLLQSSQRE